MNKIHQNQELQQVGWDQHTIHQIVLIEMKLHQSYMPSLQPGLQQLSR